MPPYLVRLVSPWRKRPLDLGSVLFDPMVDPALADALLCEFMPTTEYLTWPKPKFWYSSEALSHRMFTTSAVKAAIKASSLYNWIHFDHPESARRVPAITHLGKPEMLLRENRIPKGVAVVSNSGGMFWRLKPGIRLRNNLVLGSQVDLFGSEVVWRRFRHWGPCSRPQVPANWKGEIQGNHHESALLRKLAEYKAVVCLENTCESNYFTEKFVNAALAGAVPIYHAHETVREGVLRASTYVDPADYGFDPKETLQAALSMNGAAVQAANALWFSSPTVKATSFDAVWKRIAEIVEGVLSGSDRNSSKVPLERAVRFRPKWW